MQLNLSWFLYYGRLLHMQREEILISTIGEMKSMINAMAISNGMAQPKKPKLSYDQAMSLE